LLKIRDVSKLDDLIQHWTFYLYAMTHIACFILSIKIAERKNRLTNRFYTYAVLLSIFAFFTSLLFSRASEGGSEKIATYNFFLLVLIMVLLIFIVRIMPNII